MDFDRETFVVSSDETFAFFYRNLREVSPQMNKVMAVYAADVLRRYAQISTSDIVLTPPLGNLRDVFYNFVLDEIGRDDPKLQEVAGEQTILLNGFFRERMRVRHSVRGYDRLGSCFYEHAAEGNHSWKKKDLYRQISSNFTFLARACRDLQKSLACKSQNRFLIDIEWNPGPQS